jgi:hypothetical protein
MTNAIEMTLAEYAEFADKSFDDVNVLSFGGSARPETIVAVADFTFPDGQQGYSLTLLAI